MYQRNQKTWYKHFDFMFLDFLCMEISFFIAYIIRFGIEKAPGLFFSSEFSTLASLAYEADLPLVHTGVHTGFAFCQAKLSLSSVLIIISELSSTV